MEKKRLVEFVVLVASMLVFTTLRTITVRADEVTQPSTPTPAATQPAAVGSGAAQPAADTNTSAPTDPAATPTAVVAMPTDTVIPTVTDPSTAQAVTAATPTDTSTPEPTGTDVTQPIDTVAPIVISTPAPTEVPSTPAVDTAVPTDPGKPVPGAADISLHKTASTADPRTAQLATPSTGAPGDPIWCPSGVAPRANTGGCTNTYTSFNYIDSNNTGLVGSLSGKSTSGTIWIASGYDSSLEAGSPVSLDKSTLGTTANFALTMQGGWNGSAGNTTIIGSSTFEVPLSISWNANVTLNNIEVTGLTDSGSTALDVTTPKDITLNNISVHDNAGAGAVLDNTSGTGKVTVSASTPSKPSTFNKNANGAGLEIKSNGNISLSDVTADTNVGAGAILDNHAAASGMNVTLAGGWNEFNGNTGGNGLDIQSKGAITLQNTVAWTNTGYGAYLDNTFATTSQNVTLTSGIFQFNYNTLDGLWIKSKGAISLQNIDALDNSENGAALDNNTAATAQAVTLSGTNEFSENSSDGLDVTSLGAISANNLVDNGNEVYGAVLDNQLATTAQPVTLTGTGNQFKSDQAGLEIFSKGTITLNSVAVKDNLGDFSSYSIPVSGALLDNCLVSALICHGSGDVILNGTNTFDDNHNTGLYISSAGNITNNNLSAYGNGTSSGDSGAKVDNSQASSPKKVTLTGTNTFSNNYNDGLNVLSKGAISVSSVTANNNHLGYGTYLNNTSGTNSSITVSGTNFFDLNGLNGLDVENYGPISLNNLDAENNSNFGAFVLNANATAPQTVTITGTNTFNYNGYDGLNVRSKGNVSLNNLNAEFNGTTHMDPLGTPPVAGYGVYVVNEDAAHPAHQSVTLTGTNLFSSNWFGGLAVDSYGVITTNNLTADANGQGGFASVPAGNNGYGGTADWADGVYLNNCLDPVSPCSDPAAEAISVNGTNVFDDNNGSGLFISSTGAVTTSNVEASGNTVYWGVRIQNSYPAVSGSVTLNGYTRVNNNGSDGLNVLSHGAITATNISAQNDGNCSVGNCYGVYLDNSAASTAIPVTLNGSDSMYNDENGGLYILSIGVITINNVDSENSPKGAGAFLDNSEAASPLAVSLNGATSTFAFNYSDGLDISSVGVITVNNLVAHDNQGLGASITNNTAAAPQPVTLSGTSNFYNNSGDGLDVVSKGAITIASATGADYNSGSGAILNNNFSGAAGNISVTYSATSPWGFSNNKADGLEITSVGSITANNLLVSYNSGSGALLDNSTTATPQSVTMGGSNTFNNNNGAGLTVTSLGAVTINNLVAHDNKGTGASIINKNAVKPQSVNLSGSSAFYSNSGDGLDVLSKGAITIASTTGSDYNTGSGAVLDNSTTGAVGNVAVTYNSTSPWGFSNNSGGDGLDIASLGAITVNNLTANTNGGIGAYVDNQMPGAGGGVTLTGSNIFLSNSEYGLEIFSHGAVSLNNLTANFNGSTSLPNESGGIYVYTVGLSTTPQSVMLTGTNSFLGNGNFTTHQGDGLDIFADGNISLNNLTANGNANQGSFIDNCLFVSGNCTGSGTITMTGTNVFSHNYQLGLWFDSHKNVTLTSVTADSNGGVADTPAEGGVSGLTDGNITILGGSMTGNGSFGWDLGAIGSNSTVTLKGVFAFKNNPGGSFGDTHPEAGTFYIYRSYP